MVNGSCVELLEVYLAVTIKVALFENVDPLGVTKLKTMHLILRGLELSNCKMAIVVSIHLLEGGLELLEVMPVGLETDQDAENHLLKFIGFGEVLDIDQHFFLGFYGNLLVVKFLVFEDPGMLE